MGISTKWLEAYTIPNEVSTVVDVPVTNRCHEETVQQPKLQLEAQLLQIGHFAPESAGWHDGTLYGYSEEVNIDSAEIGLRGRFSCCCTCTITLATSRMEVWELRSEGSFLSCSSLYQIRYVVCRI
jgi:hypothetical protein